MLHTHTHAHTHTYTHTHTRTDLLYTYCLLAGKVFPISLFMPDPFVLLLRHKWCRVPPLPSRSWGNTSLIKSKVSSILFIPFNSVYWSHLIPLFSQIQSWCMLLARCGKVTAFHAFILHIWSSRAVFPPTHCLLMNFFFFKQPVILFNVAK